MSDPGPIPHTPARQDGASSAPREDPAAAGDGAHVAAPSPEGAQRRGPEDFPVPHVEAALDPAVLGDPDVSLNVKQVPASLMDWLRREAEETGESQRTVLLRVVMIAHAARPDLVPVDLPAGQLVDLRARSRAVTRASKEMYFQKMTKALPARAEGARVEGRESPHPLPPLRPGPATAGG